jgi:hypothetical protein
MVGVRIGVDDSGRERAADPPRGFDLAREAGPESVVTGQFVADHLHGNQAAAG